MGSWHAAVSLEGVMLSRLRQIQITITSCPYPRGFISAHRTPQELFALCCFSLFTLTGLTSMESPSSCSRVTRLALIHAVLAYISPEFTEMSRLPLALPTEIRLRILTHLHLTLSVSLLESLSHDLHNALDDLCDRCRAYNFHVYGESVSEWPEIKVTGGCSCAKIGVHLRPVITHDNRWDSEASVDVKFRSPMADSDPPPYFTFHLRHIAVTYLSNTSASPYTRELEELVTPRAGAKEIDALVSRVLQHFHCCVESPLSKLGAWNLGDELCVVTISSHPSDDEILCALQLALELDNHRGFISESTLHPRSLKFTPALIIQPSTSGKGTIHSSICYHADRCLDQRSLLSNPRPRNIQLVCSVGLACLLYGIRYLPVWS